MSAPGGVEGDQQNRHRADNIALCWEMDQSAIPSASEAGFAFSSVMKIVAFTENPVVRKELPKVVMDRTCPC